MHLDDERFLCVRTDGPRDGRPVVLITGLGFDLTTWPEAFVDALASHGHRVLRVDNRDTGRSFRATSAPPTARQLLSGYLPAGQYTVEDMADDVADALAVLVVARGRPRVLPGRDDCAGPGRPPPGAGAAARVPVLDHR